MTIAQPKGTPDEIASWKHSPMTRSFAKQLRSHNLKNAEDEFERVCQETSDPRVARAHAKLAMIRGFLKDVETTDA